MGEPIKLDGRLGALAVRVLPHPEPTWLAVVTHGYGEHGGRFLHVARELAAHGASVVLPDHYGHGLSDGERVRVEDCDDLVAGLHLVIEWAAERNPGLPLVLVGHSMGGLVATRYVQQYPGRLDALALSGPVVGGNPAFTALADMDPMPDVPLDPAALSRDPEVGRAYTADPLVWHGPFKRETLRAMIAASDAARSGPGFGALPTLWQHGETDTLAPLDATRPVLYALRGEDFEEHVYPGAAHEVFNETNKDEVLADLTAFLGRVLPARA
ncbi:alpha/beta hydrolase fold protein [Streptomyces albus]|uniref:Alpha/beta hydrolase fold protein n=1 Tax=Streptomyces albus (strain ATCC 21838 / DSM 41398 / FERM P-419 / JCM 4703 / NBRC 107858) TaxID=1081613 RepID=A0A0B5EGI0_STRA4|nr:alpha/beta hydrolase fold protein [Streptomyces albus]AOU74749.1 alpha/beta hydrolase fold protein [Streptomyces albus]AYN30560.1 lysophospholipase [Streptomyces albus]